MVPPRDLGTGPSSPSISALSASRSLLSTVRNIESLPTSAINLINELQDLTESRSTLLFTESFKAPKDLMQTAEVDLEMHLETLNERLEQMPDPITLQLQQLKKWQLRVEKRLQICTQLADRIDEIESKR
ncbi:hypothetical protein AnigIFM59636_001687 [Aspergillus niger]|nr:hypothetical protein AnigIFM59636_001687 [Aspergillus niger]